jgi:hypothetical protein
MLAGDAAWTIKSGDAVQPLRSFAEQLEPFGSFM